MKSSYFAKGLSWFAAAALAAVSVSAQSAGPSIGMNTLMDKLLRNFAFSAKAEMRVLDKAHKETTLMPVNYAMLDGKTRMEVDMSAVKSTDIPPGYPAFMKQKHTDKFVVISRPDLKVILVAYTNLRVFSQTALSEKEAAVYAPGYKIDKTKTGRESVDGHPCDQNRVVLTDEKGQSLTATVWTATDLKDFPIQLQMADQDTTTIMKFKDIKMVRPDTLQFEAPASFAKYDETQMLKLLTSDSPQK